MLSITRTRFDGVDGTGSLLLPTSSANNARVTYMLNFYDAADRLTATVDLGTNGGVLQGGSAGLDLDPNTNGIIDIPASAPTASTSTVLMTSYSYNSAGYLSVIADPRAIRSKTFYDNLGRTTYSVQNWTGNYDPTGNTLPATSSHMDQNQTVAYTYGSNSHMTAMTLLLPSGTPSQTTEYVYGVTTGQGSTINSNDLLRLIKHPRRFGPDAGEASSLAGDQESFTYDALGETLTHTLQNGLKHTYGYDVLGRTISDNSSGGTINQTVNYSYNALSQVSALVDARGNTTTRLYDGFGRLAQIIQPIPDDTGPQDHPTTRFFYDRGGIISLVVDANHHITVKAYDLLHRLILEIQGNPQGDSDFNAFVDFGDYGPVLANFGRTDVEDPVSGDLDHDGDVDYDDMSIVDEDFDLTGSLTFYRYLVDGDKITVTSPNGNAPGATAEHYTTTTVLDRFGRTAQVIQPSPDGVAAAPTTSYTYDTSGNVLTITDPRGNVAGATASHHTTTFTYDGLNRKLTQTSPVPNLDGTGTPSVTSWERDLIGNLISMTDPNGNTTSYTYDSRNFLFETAHPAANTSSGSVATYTIYDNDGNLTATVDGNGVLNLYVYDPLNRLIRKVEGALFGDVDADGDVDGDDVTILTNHFDEDVAVPGTLGDATYDGIVNGDDDAVIDGAFGTSRGAVTTYTYDANGNLLTMVDPLGHVAGATASHHTTSYEYDRLNRRLSMTAPDPDGASSLTAPVTTWTYDAVGNVLTVTTPRGNEAGAAANSFTTTYAYDAQNRLISITGPDPDGTGSQYAAITTYSYDASGNKIAMVDPLGNAPGATASHHTTVYAYDRLNRLISVTEPDPGDSSGHPVTRYRYDVNGNLTSVTNALNQTTSYMYDNLNRKIKMTEPDPDGAGGVAAAVTTYGYDLNGNMTSMVDPLGNAAGATASHHTTLYTYDNLNRRVRVTLPDPDGAGGDAAPVTSYTFDNNGNVLTISDPIGNVTTYTYDSFNRVLTDTNDTGHARSYEYDLNGNMIEAVDRNGRVRTFTYDNLNRMTRESWRSGNSEVGYIASTFYSDGTQESTESGEFSGGSMTLTSQQSFAYDGVGRLTSSWLVNDAISSGSFSLNSSYDVAGRRTGLDVLFYATLDFSNSYAYDNLNRLTILTQSGPGGSGFAVDDKRVDFFYDKLGQNTGTMRYNSLSNSTANIVACTLSTYLNSGRPSSQDHYDANSSQLSFYQYYDIAGRLIDFADNDDHSSSFTYDHNGQLLTVSNTGGYGGGIMPEETFNFDANGNRDSAGYATGSDNQMTQAPLLSDTTQHYTYAYDFEGNLTDRSLINGTGGTLEHVHFIWDYRNRLKEVQTYGPIPLALPAKAFYYYNAFDQRIGKLVDSNGDSAVDLTENFIYDGTNLILVTDGGSDPQQRYLTGLKTNEIFAEESSQGTPDATRWALTDHLGTVRAIADHDGNLVNVTTYRAFGEVVSHSAPGEAIRMGWTGYVYDAETRLNNAWHRYYDPRGGRFISVDPMGFGAGDTNLYRYVENDALGKTDPTGNAPNGKIEEAVDFLFGWIPGAAERWINQPIQKYVAPPIDSGVKAITPAMENTANTIGNAAIKYVGEPIEDYVLNYGFYMDSGAQALRENANNLGMGIEDASLRSNIPGMPLVGGFLGELLRTGANITAGIGELEAHPVQVYTDAVDDTAWIMYRNQALHDPNNFSITGAIIDGTAHLLGRATGVEQVLEASVGNTNVSGIELHGIVRWQTGLMGVSQLCLGGAGLAENFALSQIERTMLQRATLGITLRMGQLDGVTQATVARVLSKEATTSILESQISNLSGKGITIVTHNGPVNMVPKLEIVSLRAVSAIDVTGGILKVPARATVKLYRKMSSTEAIKTISQKQLQPAIPGSNGKKYLSNSLKKVEEFQNKGVPEGTDEVVVEFILDKAKYDRLMADKVLQSDISKTPGSSSRVEYHYEGLSRDGLQINIGVPRNRLSEFNDAILDIRNGPP